MSRSEALVQSQYHPDLMDERRFHRSQRFPSSHNVPHNRSKPSLASYASTLTRSPLITTAGT